MGDSHWRPRADAHLVADVFRRSDVQYCPGQLPTGDGPVADSMPIDMILAFFEPVDPAQIEEYREWRKERLGFTDEKREAG